MTREGAPCRAPVPVGAAFCAFHDPDQAEAVQRGREHGGRERSRPAVTVRPDERDMPVRSARDVVDLIGDTIARVRKGQLDARIANTVGYLASVTLRAIELGELSERIDRLEAAVAANARASTRLELDPVLASQVTQLETDEPDLDGRGDAA